MTCNKCNSTKLTTRTNKMHTELICLNCGAWQKFLTKQEARLYQAMYQPALYQPTAALTADQYQSACERTMPDHDRITHALHGMTSEIGELHGLYQKQIQGHPFDADHAKREVGDLLWFVSEYCTAMGWQLSDVMQTNIAKLRSRYPDGFTETNSINRLEGDI